MDGNGPGLYRQLVASVRFYNIAQNYKNSFSKNRSVKRTRSCDPVSEVNIIQKEITPVCIFLFTSSHILKSLFLINTYKCERQIA